jgi:hypothetical protein
MDFQPSGEFYCGLAAGSLNKIPAVTLSQGGKVLPVMGFRKQKPGHHPGRSDADSSPVDRDYVEDVQRHAASLSEAIENQSENYSGDKIAQRKQEQIQRHMAQLRSEALQARRLAEQIDNLSREGTTQERKTVMNDASLVDSGRSRRAADKPRASGSQSNFNPIHPSMELPPEQLIRLLGLEGKKTRTQRKPPRVKAAVPAKKEVNPAEEPARDSDFANTWTLPDDMLPASRKRATKSSNTVGHTRRSNTRHSYTDDSLFKERRTTLLLPAVAVGALAGVVVSAYLFWWQPSSQQTTVAKPAIIPVKPPAAAAAVPPKKTAATAAPSASQATSTPIERKQPAGINDENWRAAVQAQEERLRAAAEERLRDRVQAARANAAGTTATAAPAIPQRTVGKRPDLPPEIIDAPVEDTNPSALSVDTPSAPAAEQPAPPATPDMQPTTPLEASPPAEMPASPEPAGIAPEDETTALQPSVDMDDAPGLPQGLENAPAAEDGVMQPTQTNETPAAGVEDQQPPQSDTIEATESEVSF